MITAPVFEVFFILILIFGLGAIAVGRLNQILLILICVLSLVAIILFYVV